MSDFDFERLGPGSHLAWICSLVWKSEGIEEAQWVWMGVWGPAEGTRVERELAGKEAILACSQIAGETGMRKSAMTTRSWGSAEGMGSIKGSSHAIFSIRPERALSEEEARGMADEMRRCLGERMISSGAGWFEEMSKKEVMELIRFEDSVADRLAERCAARREQISLEQSIEVEPGAKGKRSVL